MREQYFLIWATLLCQGITLWISSVSSSSSFSTSTIIISSPNKPKLNSKGNLINFLKSKVENVKILSNLLNRSALIFCSLVSIHFLVSWVAFPIFGLLISGLIDLNFPIRHSWKAILNFGIIFHTFTFSIISNLIYLLIDLLIEFYLLNQTFPTSSISSESEKVLTIGICKTKQSFIHLQALQEFNEIASDDSNALERYKIYSSIEDEGSLSGEILNWFTEDLLKVVKERSDLSLQELTAFSSIINNPTAATATAATTPVYSVGFIETIIKKIFTTSEAHGSLSSITPPPESTNLPEVFARRGPVLSSSPLESASGDKIVPLIFEFGPILKKYSLGNLLISYWIASSKIYPVENSNLLQISIKSIESFICKSFEEDETGQVQLNLPKLFETTIETIKILESLSEIDCGIGSELVVVSRAEKEIDLISSLLKEMLKKISETFKETLDNVRISLKCREYIKTL